MNDSKKLLEIDRVLESLKGNDNDTTRKAAVAKIGAICGQSDWDLFVAANPEVKDAQEKVFKLIGEEIAPLLGKPRVLAFLMKSIAKGNG